MLFNSFWAFIKYYIVDNLLDQNNLMEIRTDALKLLVILRRPVPRAAATVGAWLNIFQVFIYIYRLWKVLVNYF